MLSTQQMFAYIDYFSVIPLKNESYTAEIGIWLMAGKLAGSEFEM